MSNTRVCKSCKREIQTSVLDKNYAICHYCGFYMRYHARKRISALADNSKFVEWNSNVKVETLVSNHEYQGKVSSMAHKYNMQDAILTGEIDLDGMHIAVGVMDTRFMMASMGYVVGEKVTLLFEKAKKKKIPVILFCCSGGARVQEGIISLMQMSKTAAAVKRHNDAGLLFVSILTNPTMGGVTASFAMLADIILAEKGAMVGFAGARIVEQNVGEKSIVNYQTAESQKEYGFIDEVISREVMKDYLSRILMKHDNCSRTIGKKYCKYIENTSDYKMREYSSWRKVQIARMRERPTSLDYINRLFVDFTEFHGDRVLGDDKSIVGGIAYFKGCAVTVIGQQKGKKTMEEAIYRNWGMTSPEGFRKALRLMKQAEKFNRPIICFVDTIGALCGIEAEKRGQAVSIAYNLSEMSSITVPILSIIIGEGSSGGALALAVANEVWMMENSVYSVLTPESYASIVWHNNSKACDAAELMQMGAEELMELGVIDRVIRENKPTNLQNLCEICNDIEKDIHNFIRRYQNKKKKEIVSQRYKRFRKY